MHPIFGLILRALEFLACAAALIAKKLSDSEADRVARRNQKLSNEWTLLNNLTWSQEGNDFSFVIYGGYTLICGILLLSRLFKLRAPSNLTERLLCIFGIFFFLVEGCLVFASVEHIPREIQKNAYILGGLSFLIAALLFIDVCLCSDNTNLVENYSQTTMPYIFHLPYREKTEIEIINDTTEQRDSSNGKRITLPMVVAKETFTEQKTLMSNERKPQSHVIKIPADQEKKKCKCYAEHTPDAAVAQQIPVSSVLGQTTKESKPKKYFNTSV